MTEGSEKVQLLNKALVFYEYKTKQKIICSKNRINVKTVFLKIFLTGVYIKI